MQLILDANILISFALRSKALRALQDAYVAQDFVTIVSSYLLAEVDTVLARPKFAKYISESERQEVVQELFNLAKVIQIKQPFPEFIDPKDRYLLAMLRDSDAELLVTGDKKLLELGEYATKAIISPQEFIARYLND